MVPPTNDFIPISTSTKHPEKHRPIDLQCNAFHMGRKSANENSCSKLGYFVHFIRIPNAANPSMDTDRRHPNDMLEPGEKHVAIVRLLALLRLPDCQETEL
jgi:hypothetical protein